jgi:dihydroneopterin aldolase
MQIHIEDLRFECIIGLLDFERLKAQSVVVTCKIDYLYTKDNFINYAEVTQDIITHMQNEKFELIESALEYLSNLLKKNNPDILSLYIKIAKPDILDNAIVAVSQEYNFSQT